MDIDSILKHLDTEEKVQFLSELLSAVHNVDDIKTEECIEAWEEVAEFNAIPNFKANVWRRFNQIPRQGQHHKNATRAG